LFQLTYPIMLFPALTIAENCVLGDVSSKNSAPTKWRKNFLRAGVVIATLLIALFASESLTNFVALIGGLCCVPLAFIYPSLMHAQITGVRWRVVVDYSLAAIGTVLMVVCTYLSVYQWTSNAPPSTNGHCSK
jgi:proton-coupled amino acid transporter